MSTRALVGLWGTTIGAVAWNPERRLGSFRYADDFLASGIQVAPAMMPLRAGVFDFPALPFATFRGLPGLLADSLPDRFGNLLIDRWLAGQGRTPDSFDPVERLCYIGRRGMGALEFAPERGVSDRAGRSIDIAPLVELASRVLDERMALGGRLGSDDDARAMQDILVIGTSAGGARAKAVIAWNPATGEFRSGQVDAAEGFGQWLIKFDGVSGNRDRELADPLGYGRLEYACHLLARRAGVEMMESRLHEEGGRAHFMTRRFDRSAAGDRLHMQSLGAMMHYDYNLPGAYGYEQAIALIRRLELGQAAIEEQVRRTFLNLAIRNQDDHVKNIAFLMDRSGQWRLSPAYDVGYAHNPAGQWTAQHQMSVQGLRDGFAVDDLLAFGRFADMKTGRIKAVMAGIADALSAWPRCVEEAGVPPRLADAARKGFRARLFGLAR